MCFSLAKAEFQVQIRTSCLYCLFSYIFSIDMQIYILYVLLFQRLLLKDSIYTCLIVILKEWSLNM